MSIRVCRHAAQDSHHRIERWQAMTRAFVWLALAIGMVAVGWMSAKAQTSPPTFELRVDAPQGRTMIRCVRGCKLTWVESDSPNGKPPSRLDMSPPQNSFEFACTGTRRCA